MPQWWPVGVRVEPATGQVLVAQGAGVALGVAVFIGMVVLGLLTVRLVMP